MAVLLKIQNDKITPGSDALLDLGENSTPLEFNNIYIDGKAYIDGFGESTLFDSGTQIQFRDTDIYITSGTDGVLDFHADSAFNFNTSAADIILDFDGGTYEGQLRWEHDLDYFQLMDGLMMNSTEEIYFRDSGLYLYSSADGYLDITADTRVNINSSLNAVCNDNEVVCNDNEMVFV